MSSNLCLCLIAELEGLENWNQRNEIKEMITSWTCCGPGGYSLQVSRPLDASGTFHRVHRLSVASPSGHVSTDGATVRPAQSCQAGSPAVSRNNFSGPKEMRDLSACLEQHYLLVCSSETVAYIPVYTIKVCTRRGGGKAHPRTLSRFVHCLVGDMLKFSGIVPSQMD